MTKKPNHMLNSLPSPILRTITLFLGGCRALNNDLDFAINNV